MRPTSATVAAPSERRAAAAARGASRRAAGRVSHSHEDGERRVVHVAGGQVVGAGEVVELVAEVSVPRAGGEVQRELRAGEKRDQPPDTSGCGFPHSPLPAAVVRISHAPPCPGPPPPARPGRAGLGGGLLRRSRERQRRGRRQRGESLAHAAGRHRRGPRSRRANWASLPYQPGLTLVTVNAGAPVKAGDTLWLRSGYHGAVTIQGAYNAAPITVAAQPGPRSAAAQPARAGGAELGLARPVDQPLARAAADRADHDRERRDHNFFGPAWDVDRRGLRRLHRGRRLGLDGRPTG